MRRLTPRAPARVDTPPRVLTVPVAEVWSAPGMDAYAVRRRFADATAAWRASSGLEDAVAFRVLPARSLWSVTGEDPGGRRELVDVRLAHLGVGRDDLGALAAEALAGWPVSQYPGRVGRRP